MEKFVGRKEEVSILQTALKSEKAEMIAVIGRRRIGKTFLIRRTLGKYIDFELTGIKDASLSEQLQNFSYKLTECFNSPVQLKAPKNWLEAFHQLTQYLKSKNLRRKLVIFLDELPWIATRGSRFLAALGHFWNDWAERNNVMLIICGSAASWMNTKVVHHKGSLHNRITRRIALQTFNLAEVELLLRSRNIKVDRYDILLYYMTLGGVPHYIAQIERGKSVAQNIDNLIFRKNGLLYEEFDTLFNSLFDQPDKHISIIKTLATKWNGQIRKEIVENTGLPDGGSLNRILRELEASGFISKTFPFDRKREHFIV